jgi:inosine-uridine nucleoside N-ribohydrolase
MRPRVILDCDPGHDDALAMIVAAHCADLVAITTVAGNAPLEATTRNAIVVRDLLGIDVPVHSGAARPIVAPPRDADFIHGKSGLDGAPLPEPTGPPASTDAVGAIIEACRAEEGNWLVPTGPLTNIALALRAAPDLARRIAGISLMGGGTFGNRSPAAEFNIWADPEAAAVVFGYGGPLRMCGLDLTYQFQATPARIDRIRATPGHLAATLADLLTFFSSTYVAQHDDIQGAAMHDPCAVLALTHPELFGHEPRHVVIETMGEHTRGMTVIDRRPRSDRAEPNCEMMTTIDADAAFEVLLGAFRHFSR